MADESLDVEARLIDFVTQALPQLQSQLNQFTTSVKEMNEKHKESTDNLKGAWKELAQSWDVAKIAISGMVGAMGAMEVFNRTVGFFKDARNEAKEYKTALNQLTASIGYYSDGLVEQAEMMEKTKFIDGAEVLQAQARLSLYFKEEAEIKQLIPVVLDLARAKGMDLTSAANLLAVSFNRSEESEKSTEGTLRGLGITYQKTGDRAKDLAAMVDAVESKMKGQSQAVIDSLDGWDKLGFSIKIATENFGKWLFGVSKDEEAANRVKQMEANLAFLEAAQNKYNSTTRDSEAMQKRLNKIWDDQIGSIKEQIAAYNSKIQAAKDDAKATSDAVSQTQRANDAAIATAAFQKQINEMSLEGKKRNILLEEQAEIKKYGDLEVIHRLYGMKLIEIDKQIAEERAKASKDLAPGFTDGTDQPTDYAAQMKSPEYVARQKEEEEYQKWYTEMRKKAAASNQKLDEHIAKENEQFLHRAYEETKDTVREYMQEGSALGGAAAQGFLEAEDAKKRIKDLKKQQSEELANFKGTQEEKLKIIKKYNDLIANENKNANPFKNMFKNMLAAELDFIEKMLVAKIFERTMRDWATLGPFGLIQAGAEAAVITGLFGVAKSKISSFALGTNSAPGGLSRMNEWGPETAILPPGTRVLSHNETRNTNNGHTFQIILPANQPVDHAAVAHLERQLPGLLERAADNLLLETFKAKIGVA